MDNVKRAAEVKRAVESLARGVNPFTGETDKGGILADEKVRELLEIAAKMLEDVERSEKSFAEKDADTNERRKWTTLEEMQLAEEAKQGFSVEQMANSHKRSWSGIISRLAKIGLLQENDPSGGKRWTKEEEQALTDEFSEGMPLEQLAQAHGRSMQGIIGRLSKLGLIDG